MQRIRDFDALVHLLGLVEIREQYHGATWERDQFFENKDQLFGLANWGLASIEGLSVQLTRDGCNTFGMLANYAMVNRAIEHCVVCGIDADLPIVLEVIRRHVLGDLQILTMAVM